MHAARSAFRIMRSGHNTVRRTANASSLQPHEQYSDLFVKQYSQWDYALTSYLYHVLLETLIALSERANFRQHQPPNDQNNAKCRLKVADTARYPDISHGHTRKSPQKPPAAHMIQQLWTNESQLPLLRQQGERSRRNLEYTKVLDLRR